MVITIHKKHIENSKVNSKNKYLYNTNKYFRKKINTIKEYFFSILDEIHFKPTVTYIDFHNKMQLLQVHDPNKSI